MTQRPANPGTNPLETQRSAFARTIGRLINPPPPPEPVEKTKPPRRRKLYPRERVNAARETRRRGDHQIELARTAIAQARTAAAENYPAQIAYGFLAAVSEVMGLDLDGVLRQLARKGDLNKDPEWCRAASARRFAIYLAHCCAGIKQARLVEVFGLTSAGVAKIVGRVEYERDDAVIDELLNAASVAVLAPDFPNQKAKCSAEPVRPKSSKRG